MDLRKSPHHRAITHTSLHLDVLEYGIGIAFMVTLAPVYLHNWCCDGVIIDLLLLLCFPTLLCSSSPDQQRSTVASMMHRQETVECLRKFNARRKLKVCADTHGCTRISHLLCSRDCIHPLSFALTLYSVSSPGSHPYHHAGDQKLLR